jgi:hypothetical protein
VGKDVGYFIYEIGGEVGEEQVLSKRSGGAHPKERYDRCRSPACCNVLHTTEIQTNNRANRAAQNGTQQNRKVGLS